MFKKASEIEVRDPLLVWLKGAAATGKTVLSVEFIRQFGPGLVLPSDMRIEQYQEADREPGVTAYILGDNREIWRDEDVMLKMLESGLPGSGVGALIWDSPTSGFRREVDKGQEIVKFIEQWPFDPSDRNRDKLKEALQEKFGTNNLNRTAHFQGKSTFMAKVASVATYGLPTIWVNHEFLGRDNKGKEVLKPLITDQETDKFLRNLNLRLRTYVTERGQYCLEVEWARGRPGLTGKVYTDNRDNMWRGIWAQIEADFFGAEVVDFWDRGTFKDDSEATALAMELTNEQGEPLFGDLRHAQNAFAPVKQSVIAEMTTQEMKELRKRNQVEWAEKGKQKVAEAWKAELRARIAGKADGTDNDTDSDTIEEQEMEEGLPV